MDAMIKMMVEEVRRRRGIKRSRSYPVAVRSRRSEDDCCRRENLTFWEG